MSIYRWDLDKTYLDTDFESLRGLMRAAIEPAHAKRAFPGAAALLRALAAGEGAEVHVLSGSPRQMRAVLTEKLRLDGIRFESLVLKDNIGNVRRGRFRSLRGQLGYKLPALLRGRLAAQKSDTEVLFGDDVEADALVYSLYADAISGKVAADSLGAIMARAGAYQDEIDDALDSLQKIERVDAVERIFIRLQRGVPSQKMAALGGRVVPIHSWWQAAVVLLDMGHLRQAAVEQVMVRVLEEEDGDAWAIGALAQDLLRRGQVSAESLSRLHTSDSIKGALANAIDGLAGYSVAPRSSASGPVDYMALLAKGKWTKEARKVSVD